MQSLQKLPKKTVGVAPVDADIRVVPLRAGSSLLSGVLVRKHGRPGRGAVFFFLQKLWETVCRWKVLELFVIYLPLN